MKTPIKAKENKQKRILTGKSKQNKNATSYLRVTLEKMNIKVTEATNYTHRNEANAYPSTFSTIPVVARKTSEWKRKKQDKEENVCYRFGCNVPHWFMCSSPAGSSALGGCVNFCTWDLNGKCRVIELGWSVNQLYFTHSLGLPTLRDVISCVNRASSRVFPTMTDCVLLREPI